MIVAQGNSRDPLLQGGYSAGIVGYLAGAFSASAATYLLAGLVNPNGFGRAGDWLVVFPFWIAIAIVALPGFVLLRALLVQWRRQTLLAYLIAGAVNAILTASAVIALTIGFEQVKLQGPIVIAVAGGTAGIVFWLVERRFGKFEREQRHNAKPSIPNQEER